GNTAADTIGNFDGTLQGDTAWDGNGKVAGAIVLDGDGDYIQTTLMDELQTADNFTIAAWFKTNVTDSGQQHILWAGDVAANGWGDQQEVHMGINHFNFSNKLSGYFGSGADLDGFAINIVSKEDFTDTSGWHHLALVIKNASGPTVTGSLYLDGEWVEPLVDGFETADGVAFPTIDSTDNPPDRAGWNTALRIGSPGNLSRFFNGMVDDVVVLTRALNPGNIRFLMENDPTTAVEPGGKLTTTWGEIK
ncbi:LamG domain-containing protein, partial [Candidatus Poribacteria bacterium]